MAKKTTTKKKIVDQRVVHDHYQDIANKHTNEAENNFLENMSKGFIDFRLLVKPINEKITTAIAHSISPVNMYNDSGDISVAVALNDIHYSRHGLVIRYTVSTDDRVKGAFSNEIEKRVWSFEDFEGKPYADFLISKVVTTMTHALECQFNDTLFENGLAPSSDYRWGDED